MNVLDEWAKQGQRKRTRTNDSPGATPMQPMTPGASGQLGPFGQPEPWTPNSSIRTPVVDSTPAAYSTPVPDITPGVRPPIIASRLVCPLLVCPLPVCPLLVCSHPMADTLGVLFGGGLQGLDDYNPPAKWVAQSCPIWHHCSIHVANCVCYHDDHKDTIRILDFRWSHETNWGPKLRDVSLLGRHGVRYMCLIYKSGELPRSFSQEKMVFIQRDEDVSTWLKLTWDKDIPNLVLLVLPQAAPDADGGRLLASVRWIL
jgi:hypothetical protein